MSRFTPIATAIILNLLENKYSEPSARNVGNGIPRTLPDLQTEGNTIFTFTEVSTWEEMLGVFNILGVPVNNMKTSFPTMFGSFSWT